MIQETHPGIARVKEMSAAAVLLLSLAAAIIGAYIFIPHLK
jgi:diacylglycerol kinase